jgi:hypothetical protein
MLRYAVVTGMLVLTLPCAPSFAVSPKDKMETCKFGADSQNLQGADRKKFIDRCMSSTNDPRGPGGAAAQGQPKN